MTGGLHYVKACNSFCIKFVQSKIQNTKGQITEKLAGLLSTADSNLNFRLLMIFVIVIFVVFFVLFIGVV